jgi:hypothetical protein
VTFEYVADPSRPNWAGLLPGEPDAYFLDNGEREHTNSAAEAHNLQFRRDVGWPEV